MNWAVLKNFKIMLGLIISILLSEGAIVLALNGNSYWVVLAMAAFMMLFFSIAKADKVTKQNS